MNMYVGNLAKSLTEDELKAAFAQFGEVSSVKIIMDHFSGRSKGFGFVEMPNNSEADKAIKALNKQPLQGNELKISQTMEGKKRQKKKYR